MAVGVPVGVAVAVAVGVAVAVAVGVGVPPPPVGSIVKLAAVTVPVSSAPASRNVNVHVPFACAGVNPANAAVKFVGVPLPAPVVRYEPGATTHVSPHAAAVATVQMLPVAASLKT